MNADKRFIEAWPRPPEIAPGLTLAYLIVTPSSAATSAIDPAFDKKITWIPNPSVTEATEIAIFIAKPDLKMDGWPAKKSMGTSLIGPFPLENGQTRNGSCGGTYHCRSSRSQAPASGSSTRA